MERPLPIRSPRLRDLHGLAGALLDAEPEPRAHRALLTASFVGSVSAAQLDVLVACTLRWLGQRPLPRQRRLAEQLRGEERFRLLCSRHGLIPQTPLRRPRMHGLPGLEALPPLPTLAALASWLRIDPAWQAWMADLQDRNAAAPRHPLRHYTVHLHAKPRGGTRVLEAPKPLLRAVQRQILHGILDLVAPHPAAHGFRTGRSIATYAQPHAGRAVVLRMDLEDFFPSISGSRVQSLFRTLGYPEAVADVLGGLCTVTTPAGVWKGAPPCPPAELRELTIFYARPHLPQGAPTSPALANLCALRLDRRLNGLALRAGVAYTRYADDLAFSGTSTLARGRLGFAARVAAIAREEGFLVNHGKTRLMHAGQQQRLAGLVVNQRPTLSRRSLDQLEAILVNCVRCGPATQNRDGHPDFRRHLEGRVALAAMLKSPRVPKLQRLLEEIAWDPGPDGAG